LAIGKNVLFTFDQFIFKLLLLSLINGNSLLGKVAYIRRKVVGSFPGPCASGSYVHRAALYCSLLSSIKMGILWKIDCSFPIFNYWLACAVGPWLSLENLFQFQRHL
jgi:hypothetical protein